MVCFFFVWESKDLNKKNTGNIGDSYASNGRCILLPIHMCMYICPGLGVWSQDFVLVLLLIPLDPFHLQVHEMQFSGNQKLAEHVLKETTRSSGS